VRHPLQVVARLDGRPPSEGCNRSHGLVRIIGCHPSGQAPVDVRSIHSAQEPPCFLGYGRMVISDVLQQYIPTRPCHQPVEGPERFDADSVFGV